MNSLIQRILHVGIALLLTVSAQTARATLPLDVYAALPDVTSARVSPDGQHVAMLQPVSGAPSIVVYKMGGGHCAFAPSDVKIEGVRWANSNQLYVDVSVVRIAYFHLREHLPRRWTRSILIKADCTSPRLVLGASLGQVNAAGGNTDFLGPVPGDDKHIFIGSLGRGYEVYKVDVDTGEGVLTYTTRANVNAITPDGRALGTETYRVLLDQSGALRVRVDASTTGDTRIYARLSGSNEWQEVYSYLNSEREGREMDFVGFGDDPNVVYVLSRNGGDRWMPYIFDLRSKSLGPPLLSAGQFEAAGFVLEPHSQRVVGVRVEALSGSTFQWFDRRWQQIFADLQATFEGENIVVTSASRDFKKLAVFVTGTGNPGGDYYLVDLSIPEADKIGSAYARITPSDVAPLEIIYYKARDGLEIPAYLTLPPGSSGKNLPLVVLPHGGPELRDEPEYFDWLSQFVATRGYAVLQPQFRGSAGFGRAFADAGHKQWGLAMQSDISDGVRYLIDQGIADPHKVAIFGWSYGGYAAMAGMTFTPELYRCGVAVAGISDLITMTGYAHQYEFQGFDEDFSGWSRLVGDLTRDGDRMRATSPALHADRVIAPLLLVHGKDDTIVPFGQSEEMAKALDKAGKPYQFVRVDGDDHHMYHAANRKALLQAVEPFLATCLK